MIGVWCCVFRVDAKCCSPHSTWNGAPVEDSERLFVVFSGGNVCHRR